MPSHSSEEHTSELQSLTNLVCRLIRSEEHTSELQSLTNLVCRLLLEKKKKYRNYSQTVPSYGPEGVNGGYQFIWLVRFSQPIFDPKDKLRHDIENAGYKKIEEKDFNGVVIWKYEKSNS